MKTNFVLIGIVIGLFIGVSIEQVLGEGAGVSGTAQGNTLVVNTSGQYMNGLIVANGNALILNGKMSIGNIDPINVFTVTGKAQSDGLCIGTSCITSWDDLKTIFGIVVPPIGSTHNKLPPTGITFFADISGITADASIAQDTGAFPRQDARYARPFDYTKIANDGSALPDTAVLGTGPKDWACTLDNLTGLLWEVKTPGNMNAEYAWEDIAGYVSQVNAASFGGHTDWRLPTVKELEGLSDFSRLEPAIDSTYFPNTSPSKYYFTSTLVSGVNASLYAWAVDSFAGGARHALRYQPTAVRLVHGPVSAATAYDIATVPGTAIDLRTNLMWQRCSVGQTWDGSTCTGDAQGGPWAWVLQQSVSDNFAGFTDWRAPNIKELRSLVDESHAVEPAINETVFPNTPIDAFYSSSPSRLSLGDSSLSWTVGFNRGVNDTAERYSGTFVRLVRDIKETSNNIVCTGTVPTGTTQSSLTPTTSTPWSYNTSGAACTYTCDSTHSWNGSSCAAQITHKLPPTGITIYADDDTTTANASVAVDTGAFPRQDARYNRPFDYTKIANDGSTLPATATLGTGAKDWACTKDNITGLIWEVKTTSGLRNKDYTYTWYQNNIGKESGGTCETTGRCDTEKFAQEVNQTNLCGFTDWRMPGVKELGGIIDFGRLVPAIDPTYFPGTQADFYWTGTTDVFSRPLGFSAWAVGFADGVDLRTPTNVARYVRLVRGTSVKSVYTANSNGTVTDTTTGLMWKKDQEMVDPTQPFEWQTGINTFSWQDSLQRAVTDRTGGYSDWRLPNIKELRSLVDESRFNPALDPTFTPTPFQASFWSSSAPDHVWGYQNYTFCVNSDYGNSIPLLRGGNSKRYARLVRDITP